MKIFSVLLATVVGVLVLLAYFLPAPQLLAVRSLLISWAILVGGFAMLVGVLNLVQVHFLKVRRRDISWVYSLLLLISLFVTLFIGLALGPAHAWMQVAVQAVIFPVEASLMAVLAVTLVYAAIRLLRRRTDLMTVVFLVSALVIMGVGLSLPFVGQIPVLGDMLGPWLSFGPVAGGARGILLGMALGAMLTGLRVLFAMDRPYGGK